MRSTGLMESHNSLCVCGEPKGRGSLGHNRPAFDPGRHRGDRGGCQPDLPLHPQGRGLAHLALTRRPRDDQSSPLTRRCSPRCRTNMDIKLAARLIDGEQTWTIWGQAIFERILAIASGKRPEQIRSAWRGGAT